MNFEGCQAKDFFHMLQRGGKVSTSIDDITDWLDELDVDPGYAVLTEVDIVTSLWLLKKRKAVMKKR